MVKTMRNSSLYIVLDGRASELKELKNKISYTFNSLFEDSAHLISETIDETSGEFIYELKTPIVQDEDITKEFFENIEILFYELADLNPHFTQYRRVNQ